jgi:hypothetical protein
MVLQMSLRVRCRKFQIRVMPALEGLRMRCVVLRPHLPLVNAREWPNMNAVGRIGDRTPLRRVLVHDKTQTAQAAMHTFLGTERFPLGSGSGRPDGWSPSITSAMLSI